MIKEVFFRRDFGFQASKNNFFTDTGKKKPQYNIDELEAADFNQEEEAPKQALPQKRMPVCDDVRLLDGKTGDKDNNDDDDLNLENLTLMEGEELKSNGGRNGGFSLKLRICPVFYPFIIGKRGITKGNIESETRTRITVPRENDNFRNNAGNNNNGGGGGSFITITGADRRSLLKAKRRLDALIASFRNRQSLTHFVAIPIGSTNEQIRSRFEAFKTAVLSIVNHSKTTNIFESTFQSAARLHLTLRALYLGDAAERKQATSILQALKTEVLDGLMKGKKPVKLRMKGLDYMNDDPSEVRVLFAKVEETEESGGLFKEIVNRTFD